MMKSIISKTIYIDPEYLNSDIYDYVLYKLQHTNIGKCTKKEGSILNVTQIIDVTPDKNTDFIVEYEIESFLPETNKVYQAIIESVEDNHYNVIVENVQKVFIKKNNKKEYSDGEDIEILITRQQYSEGCYKCIGRIV